MKRLFAMLLALCVCALYVPAFAEADDGSGLPAGLVTQECVMLMADAEHGTLLSEPVNGAFQAGEPSIFFMSVQDYFEILTDLDMISAPMITYDDDTLMVSRANGSAVVFSREDNRMTFTDVDLFFATPYAVNGGDIASVEPYQKDPATGETLVGEDGEPLVNLLAREDNQTSYYRTGAVVSGTFDAYDIPVYWADDDLYLPLPVFNTMMNCNTGLSMVYLDGVVYVTDQGKVDTVCTDDQGYTQADYYYATEAGDRPEALAELTYNVLCMELDLNYGLKSEHGIGDDFDEFLETVGLKEKLLDPDGQTFYEALVELAMSYFADFHSSVGTASPYAGAGYSHDFSEFPVSMRTMIETMRRFYNARSDAGLAQLREESYHNQTYQVFEPYMEVGDTAYVTFDSFYSEFPDFYSEEFQENIEDYIDYDTIALISYANSQINREDSPIRKVVLDLSCNGGGIADTALFVTSWMLGDCKFSCTNPTTGANYTVVYKADVDLDGKITDADHLDSDKLELYCLTSCSSFSCGNLVPAQLKESGRVTMLGQTTGGGACVVQSSVLADGTIFNYSGNKHICTVKNGSYYSVDQGVEPDYVIRKTAHFYDREWLTQFIEDLA